jgi:hypothetical protein
VPRADSTPQTRMEVLMPADDDVAPLYQLLELGFLAHATQSSNDTSVIM